MSSTSPSAGRPGSPTATAEALLASLVLDPNTRQTCQPRYDETLVTAAYGRETLVIVVFRSRRRAELRVVQLERQSEGWSLLDESSAAVGPPPAVTPQSVLEYPERRFHFVPGTGEAPEWVDQERRTRCERSSESAGDRP